MDCFSQPVFVDQDGLRVDFQPNGVDFQNGGDLLPREAGAEGAEGVEGDLLPGGGEMDRTSSPPNSFSSLLLASLELSDTKVYEP